MTLMKVPSSVHQPLSAVLDTVLPTHSLITGQVVTKFDQKADTELWQHLKFIDDPCCQACGFPFEFEPVGLSSDDPSKVNEALCLRCHAHAPAFDRARAAITYDETSRKLILDFKHGGRTDGLKFFAAQMLRAGQKILADTDMLIPVPLHKSRLRKRRFNQATLLARGVSQLSNIPYHTEILMRNKNTPSQGGQTFLGRRQNVTGAFNVRQKYKPNIKGKHITLIDDVYTTGSTLTACARTLKRAGAARVDALTFMRVVRPQEITK